MRPTQHISKILCIGLFAICTIPMLSGCKKSPPTTEAPTSTTPATSSTTNSTLPNTKTDPPAKTAEPEADPVCSEEDMSCGELEKRSGSQKETTACGMLSWSGAAPDGKASKTVKGTVRSLESGRRLTITYDWDKTTGTIRLNRSTKDPRSYVGPWARDKASGIVRLNFATPFTEATGFWTASKESKTRRRVLLKPCP